MKFKHVLFIIAWSTTLSKFCFGDYRSMHTHEYGHATISPKNLVEVSASKRFYFQVQLREKNIHAPRQSSLPHNKRVYNHQFPTNEQAQIAEKQQRRSRCLAQQRAIARKNFKQQKNDLDVYALQWEHEHAFRYAAYQKACEDGGHEVAQTYQLSTRAQQTMGYYGLACESYNQFYGNALQQELMQEAIAGVEQLSHMNPPFAYSFNGLLYAHTFDTYDAARQSNEMGDCISSAQLIDLASTLKNYCAAVLQGAVVGIKDGVQGTMVGAYQMVCHPIDSALALKDIAFKLAALSHEYLPPMPPDESASIDAWDVYAHECKAVANQWEQSVQVIRKNWDETPTHEIIHHVSYGIANLSTNVMVGSQCLKLLSSVARCAVIEAYEARRYTAAVLAEYRTVSPGFILIDETAIAARGIETATNDSFTLVQSGDIAKVWTRCNRMTEFCKWKEGINVDKNHYIATDHFLNSLKKSGRKDIMPDEVINALHQIPIMGETAYTWQYVDPNTGTKVFVNELNQLIGVQPSNFK